MKRFQTYYIYFAFSQQLYVYIRMNSQCETQYNEHLWNIMQSITIISQYMVIFVILWISSSTENMSDK